MTTESHELVLTIVNDGKGYEERCQNARRNREGLAARIAAVNWTRIAIDAVYKYEREFGGKIFSPEDILLAAAELARYYEEHVREGEEKQEKESPR